MPRNSVKASHAEFIRVGTLTLLLTGSLLPPIGGISLIIPALVLAVPLIAWEFMRLPEHAIPVLLFLGVLYTVIVWDALFDAPATEYGKDKLYRFVTLTLLSALAAMLVRHREGMWRLARVWLFAGVVLALSVASGASDALGRSTGYNDSNPIWLARAMSTAIIFTMWLYWNKRLKASVAVVAILLLGVAIFQTGSRAPLVGAAIGVLILAAFAMEWRGSKLIAMIGGVILVYAGVQVFASQSRIGQLLINRNLDVSSQVRETFFSQTINLIRDQPKGVGMGQWYIATDQGQYGQKWPHNLFLEVFAEEGVIVGLIFTGLVAWVLVRLVKRAAHDQIVTVVLAILVAEIIAVSLSGDLNARAFFCFLTLGVLINLWTKRSEQPSEPSQELASKSASKAKHLSSNPSK